ncbi:hypothetical protein [Deinococcus peraridilitoris]|uniref:Uncharacterized protein n=1 Tax=Deinococcus peraridilitoris (strain DSM 19664 / LMG 22246 / CIP 109416 / KR-200) TaxID=937777 RepID=K9ZZ36_DEIPD|nr:hypothetical protein [Deinococcus peraridilitoris]AFZ66172.1 hypothetical protein Deipe_0581 [Deinococcus peraridilitoris DSM 19664]
MQKVVWHYSVAMPLLGLHARLADAVRDLLKDQPFIPTDEGQWALLHELLSQLARDFTGRDVYPEEVHAIGHGGVDLFESWLKFLEQVQLQQYEADRSSNRRAEAELNIVKPGNK